MLSGSANHIDAKGMLERSEWMRRREAHLNRIAHWADDRVSRATKAIPDPVFDFLFTYYSFRPAYLKRWSPGPDVVLRDASEHELDWPQDFQNTDAGWVIPAKAFPTHRVPYLRWAIDYLEKTQGRTPTFYCFGLHEWAMVYKTPTPRHAQVQLRLSPQEIESVVEQAELRCSHYDAFRFFTPDAVPLNRNSLTRDDTSENDQRGCIHVTMDLYRFANKIAPWCPSELLADAFLLAADARMIDMRSSPYDLSEQGFTPIRVEEASGREEFIQEQRRLAEKAQPLRAQMLGLYRYLLAAHEGSQGATTSLSASQSSQRDPS
jgi:hypothetical protein